MKKHTNHPTRQFLHKEVEHLKVMVANLQTRVMNLEASMGSVAGMLQRLDRLEKAHQDCNQRLLDKYESLKDSLNKVRTLLNEALENL